MKSIGGFRKCQVHLTSGVTWRRQRLGTSCSGLFALVICVVYNNNTTTSRADVASPVRCCSACAAACARALHRRILHACHSVWSLWPAPCPRQRHAEVQRFPVVSTSRGQRGAHWRDEPNGLAPEEHELWWVTEQAPVCLTFTLQ